MEESSLFTLFTPVNVAIEKFGCNKEKSALFQKAGVIPPMEESSPFTLFTPVNVAIEKFGCNKENLTYFKKPTTFRQEKKVHCLHCLHPLLMRKWMSLLIQALVQTEN
ncbi:hypothetical protein AVEN_42198-1 [Araneus ventricosus]|uniref:Uncharacterized protein n=1 Tax=Araneus ventricosus TaxID=182803 RepID=A0A4Y2AYI8_ARAVE|nr:hypothetical protein AVEN_42198-1 [Araneus ventricosus]